MIQNLQWCFNRSDIESECKWLADGGYGREYEIDARGDAPNRYRVTCGALPVLIAVDSLKTAKLVAEVVEAAGRYFVNEDE